MSIRLETFDRARHRQELRKYTDLELILSGRQLRTLIENEKNIVSPFESSGSWKLQIEDAVGMGATGRHPGEPAWAYASAMLRPARRSRPGPGCGKRPDMKRAAICEPWSCVQLASNLLADCVAQRR